MAIKERLLKQLNIVRDGLNAMPPFHSRGLNAMRNALVQARDLCFQGLSENRFAEYKDTYDGLLFAIDQLGANASDEGEIVSLCSELLQYTITQTQKEISFKKEIFFLPYKASMWDSLESVWKAAYEDKEHCIAYVMPIPYADLTPEHTVAEWHCERGMFPENVSTLDWQTVDLSEMHPDVIFIHTPYDNYNAVTSVESRYYSKNLKQCTDKLVYIPYFVLDEIEPGNEAAEEDIVHFVMAPAVLVADWVVVQSEAMRQVYINLLIRHTNIKDRSYWEGRITGEGSPKIDKVLCSKKEDFELPEMWKKVIAGKKVVLFNTGLMAILGNADKVCEKLQYVFSVFRGCDDVALWWRPHPLTKATIKSMHPEIKEKYTALEHDYKMQGWGVYDDTADIHRAIKYSDVYYGDGSSVMHLYKKTNKPLMMQNYCLDIAKDYLGIAVSRNAIISGDYMWILSSPTGIILQFDLRFGNLIDFFDIPKGMMISEAYVVFLQAGNIFFIAPFNEKNFYFFAPESKMFREITLPLRPEEFEYEGKFRIATYIDEKIYLIGKSVKGIFRIKPDTLEVKRFSEYISYMESLSIDVSGEIFGTDFCVVGKKIYLPMLYENILFCFDTSSDSFVLFNLELGTSKGLSAVTHVGSNLVIADKNDNKIVWNPVDGVKSIVRLGFLPSLPREYRKIFFANNKYYYFPSCIASIFEETGEGKFEIKFEYPHEKGESYRPYHTKYEALFMLGNKIFFQARTNGAFYYIDTLNDAVYPLYLSISIEMMNKIRSILIGKIKSMSIKETDFFDLQTFLKCDRNSFHQDSDSADYKISGQSIYGHL